MAIRFIEQRKNIQGYQGVFWSIFSIDKLPLSEPPFIDGFVRSKNFRYDCLPDIVKENRDKKLRYLSPAFNEDVLSVKDFKVLKKDELVQHFEGYSKDGSWGDDLGDFINLKNLLKEIIQDAGSDGFFLIDKDWFGKGDAILNSDSEFFIYFFFIIWLDAKKMTLNVCRLNYD